MSNNYYTCYMCDTKLVHKESCKVVFPVGGMKLLCEDCVDDYEIVIMEHRDVRKHRHIEDFLDKIREIER